MKRSILRYARPVLIVTAVTSVIWVNAGSLTPPGGPVAPTMKSLDQVEARTIVNATNTPGSATNTYVISLPGSYYLTGNITGTPGKHGISIQANDVTLDLNGFSLTSGGGGATRGIDMPFTLKGFCIRNGSVSGWTGGGVWAENGAGRVQDLRLSGNVGATGLALREGLVNGCTATGNGIGFSGGLGAELTACAATGNTTGFITGDRCQISNCISTENAGVGINCGSYCTVIDCTSSRNGTNGIVVNFSSSVIRCNASRNIPLNGSAGGSGIVASAGSNVTDCTANENTNNGISLGSDSTFGGTVSNCTTKGNSYGIIAWHRCLVVGNSCDGNLRGIDANDGNRIDGNSCTGNANLGIITRGHNVVIRNTCRGNGVDFSPDPTDVVGPIVNMAAGGTIGSLSAWTNFIH